MTLSLETLSPGEDSDLNLHDNLTLIYYAFPGHLPYWLHTLHLLSSAGNGIEGDEFSHFGELHSFPGSFPCIQEIYILLNFVFFPLIFYYRDISVKNSEE